MYMTPKYPVSPRQNYYNKKNAIPNSLYKQQQSYMTIITDIIKSTTKEDRINQMTNLINTTPFLQVSMFLYDGFNNIISMNTNHFLMQSILKEQYNIQIHIYSDEYNSNVKKYYDTVLNIINHYKHKIFVYLNDQLKTPTIKKYIKEKNKDQYFDDCYKYRFLSKITTCKTKEDILSHLLIYKYICDVGRFM